MPVTNMLKSRRQLQGSVLSFHHVDSREGTRDVRLSVRYHYPLKYLTGPNQQFYYKL